MRDQGSHLHGRHALAPGFRAIRLVGTPSALFPPAKTTSRAGSPGPLLMPPGLSPWLIPKASDLPRSLASSLSRFDPARHPLFLRDLPAAGAYDGRAPSRGGAMAAKEQE